MGHDIPAATFYPHRLCQSSAAALRLQFIATPGHFGITDAGIIAGGIMSSSLPNAAAGGAARAAAADGEGPVTGDVAISVCSLARQLH